MIRILSISGCSRVKPIKVIATNTSCPYQEINQLKYFLDSIHHEEEFQMIADFYHVSKEKLQNTPSIISKPLILIESELLDEEVTFLEQLQEKGYFECCETSCTKSTVCPARERKIDILTIPHCKDCTENVGSWQKIPKNKLEMTK